MHTVIKILFFLATICCPWRWSHAQTPVYLIPGQGADERLYSRLDLGQDYELRPVMWVTPYPGMDMHEYARLLARQIDTTDPYVLIGTSLGGMLATEMSTFLHPECVIIISSAKNRTELPQRYRFQRFFPLHDLIPPRMAKWGALVLQPIVEPDRNTYREVFISMLQDKDPLFLSRTIDMIIHWDRSTSPPGIIHIHGDQDHTLPIRLVDYDYRIKGGSHMMVLTRAGDISRVILQVLSQP